MGWLRYSLLLPGEGRGAGEGSVLSCGVTGLDGVGVSPLLLPAPELACPSLVLKVLSSLSFSSAGGPCPQGQEGDVALAGASPRGVGAALRDQVQPPGTVTAPAVAQPLQLPPLFSRAVFKFCSLGLR